MDITTTINEPTSSLPTTTESPATTSNEPTSPLNNYIASKNHQLTVLREQRASLRQSYVESCKSYSLSNENFTLAPSLVQDKQPLTTTTTKMTSSVFPVSSTSRPLVQFLTPQQQPESHDQWKRRCQKALGKPKVFLRKSSSSISSRFSDSHRSTTSTEPTEYVDTVD